MAVFGGVIRSSVLGMDTGLQVILPFDRPAEGQQTPCKVLYLLHGLGENCTAWCRHSAIERYARDRGLAVIMPEVQRSFYADMRHGIRYFSYLTRELPRLCADMFQLSQRRADTFVAGLSMGGYGALRCALACPDRYAAAASFSGAVDLRELVELHGEGERRPELTAMLGESLEVREDQDLFALGKRASQAPQPPRVLMTCGEQDDLLEMNRRLAAHLEGLLPEFAFQSWEGAHEWSFWDRSVQLALKFFLDGQ